MLTAVREEVLTIVDLIVVVAPLGDARDDVLRLGRPAVDAAATARDETHAIESSAGVRGGGRFVVRRESDRE